MVDPTGEYLCGSGVARILCDQFQESLQIAQQAADKLKKEYGDKSSQYTDAQRAIDAYGKEGIDNGVTVQAANTGAYGGSTNITQDSSSPTGARITVTLGKSDFDGSADSGIGAAHEGSHVADAQDWIASGFNPRMRPTMYGTEFRAYLVTAHLAEAMDMSQWKGIGPSGQPNVLWKSGFMPSQTDAAIKSILRREYKLTPQTKIRAWQENTNANH
jgi:hypothetical protein